MKKIIIGSTFFIGGILMWGFKISDDLGEVISLFGFLILLSELIKDFIVFMKSSYLSKME